MKEQYANTVFYNQSFKDGNTVGCIFHTTEDELEAERINQYARQHTSIDENGEIDRLYFVHKYIDGEKVWH